MSQDRGRRRGPARAATAAAVVAAVFLAGALAFAGQEGYREPVQERYKWMMGAAVGGAFPVGSYMDNFGHVGINLSLSAGRRLGNSPFMVTFECCATLYSLHTRHEYLSGTIPVLVEVTTSDNQIQGLFGLRFQPGTSRIRPYLEGLAGLSYFYAETVVSENEYPYNEIASQTDFDDTTFCAGGGAGMDILLAGGRRNANGTAGPDVRFDFKVRYLFGGRARYLRADSIVYVDGNPTYIYRESATNLISAQVGIVIDF